MQQKVVDQQEALEIAMKIETAPVGDNSGIAQIQAQLAEMNLELRDMKKGKSIQEEVWCTRCKTLVHFNPKSDSFFRRRVDFSF